MSNAFKKPTNILLFFTIFILITTFMTFLIIMYFKNKQIVIETKSGKIIGTTVTRFDKVVTCYFGVPFAQPPVGDLRFKKPEPVKQWKDTLKATKQPNYCWQSRRTNVKTHSFDSKSFKGKAFQAIPDWKQFYENEMSEDCLYLNIYVPPNSDKSNLKTVMVWIYGGSFQSGTISEIFYDGSILAAKTDVIVVALNYRLGIFGFLAADDPELPGNYGLHDQVMALQWINDNIKYFGGNPNNIVIFGESAGAISVGYHLISPLSKDLFGRAILQSGNPIVPIMSLPKKFLAKGAVEMVRLSNCPIISTDLGETLDDSSISCLRAKSASLIYELSHQAFPQGRGAFVPVEDNDFFVEHPYELVKKNYFFSEKEILIGTNSVEGAHFARYGPFNAYWFGDRIDFNFTKDKLIEILNKTLPEEFQGLIQEAVEYSLDNLSDDSDPIQVWNRFIQIVGDIIFVCSDYLFINEYSASNRTVYYYQFRPKPSYTFGPGWADGAVHADEIEFVFGIPLILQNSLLNYSSDELKLSETLLTVWTTFAKTGKPSCCGSWIQYKYDEPLYMSFDIKQNDEREYHMKQGFPGYRCGQYYEELITQLRNYFLNGNEIPA